MKTYWNKKSKLKNSKHGRRKCLIYNIKRYLNRWLNVYCKNTGLHGFRYITMDRATVIDSAFWSVVCISSIIFCVILMLRLWDHYSNNPIVTTIDTTSPIWAVSFPSITICNNNKVYGPHADIIAKSLYTNGFSIEDSDKFFFSLVKLIRPDKNLMNNATSTKIFNSLNMTVEMLMKQLMQPCSTLLVRCVWVGQVYDCNKIFKPIKSREGFCCAFNSHYNLNVKNKNFKIGEKMHNSQHFNSINVDITSTDLPGAHKILKAPGSGRDVGLSVALNVEGNTYKANSRPYIGASVMIHDPIDFPDIGTHTVSVLPGHILVITVSSTSIKSMESLRYLPIEKRLCYFDNEVPGETRYSYQSCVSECLAKNIQRLCGCLPFYYPEKHSLRDNLKNIIFNALTDEGVRTCFLSDLDCLLNIRRKPEYWKMKTCRKCLPQCTDIMYHINLEDVKMDDVTYDSDISRGLNTSNLSFLNVFFGDLTYVEYRKENIISWDSLLASFGGIFGLCLGGSVMSVIELVYFSIKQFFNKVLRQPRKRQERSRTSLPPASEMFLSIPVARREIQLQKPQSHKKSNDKRVFVTCYQPAFYQRETTNYDNEYHDRVKF